VAQVPYAPQPRSGTGFTEDVETVRNSLRGSADGFTRLRAVVAPRSAVRVIYALAERRSAFSSRWAARWGGWPWWPSRQQS
jgi:hypothetical protein